MTVSAKAPFVTRTYTGFGDYDFDFLVYDVANLQITLVDSEDNAIVLTTANYSAITLSPEVGGTVTVFEDEDNEIPSSGTLYIRRILPYQQSIDWINNEAFDMELLERSQDQLVMMIQQIAQSAADLSVIVSWPEGVPDLYALLNDIQTTILEIEGDVSDIELIQNLSSTYSTITDMASEANVANGMVADVLGYSGAGDGGGGEFTYLLGNFAAAVAADTAKGMYVPRDSDPTGSAGVWKRRDTTNLSALYFGMSNVGVVDAGPGLRGIASLSEYLGGLAVRFPRGTYRLSTLDLTYEWTKDGRHVANFPSNTHLIGLGECELWLDGATLDPIMETGYRFNTICLKKGSNNSSVRGFKFTTAGWVLTTDFEDCHGVSVGGDYCEVSNCWFYNLPGRNHLTIGYNNQSWPTYCYAPRGTKIFNNIFQNGSDVVPGNTVAVDCGFIYNDGYESLVEGNTFINDSLPTINCSGVENHNGRNKYVNNKFKNLWPAVYIGLEGDVKEDVEIRGNHIETCYGGVQTIQSCDGIKVLDNFFKDIAVTSNAPGAVDHQGGKPLFSTLAGSTGIADGELKNVLVRGNTFLESERVDTSCVYLGALQDSSIHDNTFSGYPECVVVALATNFDTFNVTVHDNICSRFSDEVFGYVRAIMSVVGGDSWASSADHVHFWNNTMINDLATSHIREYNLVGTMATLTNCTGDIPKSKNILVGAGGSESDQFYYPDEDAAPEDYTPFWTQSTEPQPSLGNGSIWGKYKVIGNLCTVVFDFQAGTTTTFGNGTSGWYFGLPKKAAIGYNQRSGMSLEVQYVSYPATVIIGADEWGFSLGLNANGVRLDYPAVHDERTWVRGTFQYFCQPDAV